MPENKQTVQRTSSYLSHSAYRKIKRVLSFRRRVFGQRLEETVLYERRYGDHMAPLVVEQCVDFIREHGLLEVGLFRQPGQATLVKELQEAFDAGEKPSFDSSTDVHTVASLLKLYLRELPEPLVPFSCYQEFLTCGKKIPTQRDLALLELRNLLHELPVANFNLLNYICSFLNEVQSYSSTNKMSIQNLATVFGPNILRPKAEDPESIIGGAAAVQNLMSELIREHTLLFSREVQCDVSKPSPPASLSSHRHYSQVEWMSTNPLTQPDNQTQPCLSTNILPSPTQASISHNAERRKPSVQVLWNKNTTLHPFNKNHHIQQQQQHDKTEASSSQTSPTLMYEKDTPPHQSHIYQSLPTGLLPPPPPPSPPTACPSIMGESVIAEQAEEQADGRVESCDWAGSDENSWEREKGLGGMSGSSEAQDSTMSVYDNMNASEHGGEEGGEGEGFTAGEAEQKAGTASVAGSSSSWSSCEVLLPDGREEGRSGGTGSPCHSATRFPSYGTDHREAQGELHPNSPTSSSVPTDAPLSTGSSEVFLPSAPPDPQGPIASHAIQCLLTGLQQQMARQRAEYEAKIYRLERKNEVLQGEVAGLRSSLEQQRRWVSMAEIKMRNVERARADADRRNATLQQEMEQFFDSFGELNSEARKAERIVQSF
ncbi:rho GTPase-activating protein 24 [Chanos chanos]|uniref:Rho GTPase-activating protein 24 n=1 Tax=Chanos chanos TaxID=29144 RepID=A0A6J2W738_CHACN|nr:rho GTPase-activating protein 24-like [Chanos chanos]